MQSKTAIRAEAARLQRLFEGAGAQVVETNILQPADILLDLYGEDIRARAFVTHDPSRGEQMLRPDFTVPVVQMHMKDGAEPARYTYSGEVFRRQEDGKGRASETLQVGYEVFDRSDPATADAEVFSLFAKVLSPLKLRPITGDMSIIRAAVMGLATTDRRKSALLRHIWRPNRFKSLLERYAGITPVPQARQALLDNPEILASVQKITGARTLDEISTRIDTLVQDAKELPISQDELGLLGRILELKSNSVSALARLKELTSEMPALGSVVQSMSDRLDALERKGVDVQALDFDASYGRLSMEYYDGFVFGFYAADRPEMPPIASGGRYDALTRVLGQGRSIPAVGGVIRPELYGTLT